MIFIEVLSSATVWEKDSVNSACSAPLEVLTAWTSVRFRPPVPAITWLVS